MNTNQVSSFLQTTQADHFGNVKAYKEQQLREAITSPSLFTKTFLQTDLWDLQEEILEAVAVNPRVAVKACHASGKTYLAARALLWFLARFTESIVVTTAPTWIQVEKLLWGEVHSALIKSLYPFPKPTLTELKFDPQKFPRRYAYGLSTTVTKQDEGVKFQGIHAENVLVILDEAPGVEPKIWEAIEGARAGGNVRVLAIGNPTIGSGPFHSAWYEARNGWKLFTISAFDTPNLKGITLEQLLDPAFEKHLDDDEKIRPYLTRRRWVRDKYYEWGPGHPLWESRVLGEFPTQSEDALLSLAWLEQASRSQTKGEGKLVAGLDVAGPGEAETVLVIRRGGEIIEMKWWAKEDPRGSVVAALSPYMNELEAVNVDSIGVGWGMYCHLKELGFPAVPINVGEGSHEPKKFVNLKAEFYWNLRCNCFFPGRVSKLKDEKTIGQLAGIRYRHTPDGRIEIESKEQASKRGVKSPDRAEALMLAFAERRLIYGVMEYLKEEQVRINNMQKIEVVADMMKPLTVDRPFKCPECGATCITRCATSWRCNQCGIQFLDGTEKASNNLNTKRDDMMKIVAATRGGLKL